MARHHSRNRWRATTGPPQTLRRQAQRLSRFGGRAARSGRPDAEEVVVGGAVEGRLKVTCRGRPAVSAAAWGPVVYHRERILETSTLSCNEEEEEITKPPKR